MNTKQQDQTKNRQVPDNGSNGSKYDDQSAQQRSQQQKRSAFDEGLMDNDDDKETEQPSKNTDPEIDTPVQNPEKTEKKIPEMKGNNK